MELRQTLLALGVAVLSCRGADGAPGSDGQDGDNANFIEVRGQVFDAEGHVGEGHLVLVNAIDDGGRPIGTLGGTLTFTNGHFSVSVDDGIFPSSRLAVFTEVDGTSLRASMYGSDGIEVTPVSTAVFEAVVLVTESTDGRSLDDFAIHELKDLNHKAAAALAETDIDLTDPQAVLDAVLASIGGLIADYSGGKVRADEFTLLTPADLGVGINLTTVLYTANSYAYVVERRGSVTECWGPQYNGYDGAFRLTVDGEEFPEQQDALLEDGSEVKLGPVQMGDIAVTRKAFGNSSEMMLRFTEVFDNPSAAPVTIAVKLWGNLGMDDQTFIEETSSGDDELDADDTWFIVNDVEGFNAPFVGFWFGAGASEATVVEDNYEVSWNTLTIAPNSVATIVHYGLCFTDTGDMAPVVSLLDDVPSRSVAGFPGMRQDHYNANITFSQGGIVVGEAGSVASFAQVALVNLDGDGFETLSAASDGSFSATVGGDSNDRVRVTASDDTDVTITLP